MLRVLSSGALAPSLHIARITRLSHARQASSSAAEHTARSAGPARPALLQLRQAYLPLPAAAAPVSLTISDAPECWAIVGGDGDGERVVEALRDVMTGRRRARTADGKPIPSTHPFLGSRSPAEHVVHVSFAARAATGGEFVDYAVRYGAVRDDEDAVTLHEGCMRALGHHTGRAARLACVADILSTPSSADQAKPGAPTESERAAGRAAHQCIMDTAPLLRLDRPPPAEESNGDMAALLHTPLIRLSNGQMRRARLLEALVRCRLSPAADSTILVLSQPYNGLDPPTRSLLSSILADRHCASDPRIVLFLRVQDELPAYITHVAQVRDDGSVQAGPRALVQQQRDQDSQGGYELLKQNAAQALPDTNEPLVSLNGVDIKYVGKSALESIALDIHRGARMVLAGYNGSGKSTLLSLILGDHPQSFALPEQKLSLFGKARDAPGNATLLLARRIGHVSPELFNAFPRKDTERGGMTVGEAIGSGYAGVFSRRPLDDQQKARIWRLLAAFQDVIDAPDSDTSRQSSRSGGPGLDDPLAQAKRLASASFAAMSLGSQSIVLLLRAIVHGPKLLILDEPFQHQSARQVERARAFLDEPEAYAIGETEQERAQDAEARRAMSLILVSHYEAEWPRSMNALLRLEAGQVSERIGQC